MFMLNMSNIHMHVIAKTVMHSHQDEKFDLLSKMIESKMIRIFLKDQSMKNINTLFMYRKKFTDFTQHIDKPLICWSVPFLNNCISDQTIYLVTRPCG